MSGEISMSMEIWGDILMTFFKIQIILMNNHNNVYQNFH